MKYLNYLFVLIISVLLLSGCGILGDDGSDTEKEFEPYKIGSFKITSPVNASYTGITSSKKLLSKIADTDTLVVTEPSGFSFEIWKDSTFFQDEAVAFRYTDSTKAIAGKLGLIVERWSEDLRTPLAKRSLSSGNGIYTIEGYFGSPCEWRVEDDIYMEYYEEKSNVNNTPFRVIVLRTDSLAQVGKELLGCAK